MALPIPAPPRPPAGIAFDIAELTLVRGWAEARGLRMEIALDQARGNEDCEELIVLRRGRGAPAALILWRSSEMVVVESSAGVQRFRFLSEALDRARRADAWRA